MAAYIALSGSMEMSVEEGVLQLESVRIIRVLGLKYEVSSAIGTYFQPL